MPKKGWSSISLTTELMKEIDELLTSDKGKKLGFKSRADFITRATIQFLKEQRPRFEHLNMMDDNVKVVDFTNNRIATIYFKNPNGVRCDLCATFNCVHIDYALAQPSIQKELKKHDWKRQKHSCGREADV